MKSPSLLALGLGVVLGLLLSVPAAQAENRPTELDLFQRLNGETYRDLNAGGGGFPLADGGGLSLMTLDAGIGCNTLRTGAVYEMHCDSPVHFCPWGDGGCSNAIGSQAYGKPVNASTPSAPFPFYFVVEGNATSGATKLICITPASGDATAICAPFRMK